MARQGYGILAGLISAVVDEPLPAVFLFTPYRARYRREDGSMLRAAVAQHADNTSMAGLWYSMPFRDSVSPLTGNDFWNEVGPWPYLPALRESGIASYFWSNLKDEPTSQMILAAANLNGRLLVGPGGHCAPPPDYDLAGEVQRFFDFHLKGINNGIDDEPRTTLWVENAAEDSHWIRSDLLPGEASEYRSWHAGPGGRLGTDPAAAGQDDFLVNFDVGSEDYFAFWVESQAEHGLVFASAPLQNDLHLEGYPVAHIKLSADRQDANVFAYLEEVDRAGKASVLAMGRLAAGHALRLVVTGADPRQRNLQDILPLPALRSGVQLFAEFVQRLEAGDDVLAHCLFGKLRTAFDDGLRDDAVVGVRRVDALGTVETREHQAVNRHRQLGEELGHIAVARTFNDQRVPGIVELGKAVVVTRAFEAVHRGLQLGQAVLQQLFVAACEGRGGHAFQRHARGVDLADLVHA